MSSKPRVSIRLTAQQRNNVIAALDYLRDIYGPLYQIWPDLTSTQREWVLLHSPLLTRLVNATDRFSEK